MYLTGQHVYTNVLTLYNGNGFLLIFSWYYVEILSLFYHLNF